jgi:hypothetical protein
MVWKMETSNKILALYRLLYSDIFNSVFRKSSFSVLQTILRDNEKNLFINIFICTSYHDKAELVY